MQPLFLSFSLSLYFKLLAESHYINYLKRKFYFNFVLEPDELIINYFQSICFSQTDGGELVEDNFN